MTAPLASRRLGLRARHLLPCLVALAACESTPYAAMVHVRGGEQLNPKLDGTATSVNVRILQLSEKGRAWFEQADAESLIDSDADALRGNTDVLDYREAQVYVGTNSEVEVTVQPETKFLGVAALFNRLESGAWKALLPIDELDDRVLTFDGCTLTVAPDDQ